MGLEPTISCSVGKRLIQLGYACSHIRSHLSYKKYTLSSKTQTKTILQYIACLNHHLRKNCVLPTECARGKLHLFVASFVRTIKDIESYQNEVKSIEQRITELKEQKADEYDIKYQVRIGAHIDCRSK